jgi:hypothetical protein
MEATQSDLREQPQLAKIDAETEAYQRGSPHSPFQRTLTSRHGIHSVESSKVQNMPKHYVYRMDHDTGNAPNVKYGICTLWLLFSLIALSLLVACSSGSSALTPLPYADNFDNPGSGWKTVADPIIQVQYQDSALQFRIDDFDQIAWSTPKDRRFGDFTLDVDATQVEGPDDNSYGIIVRYIDDRNFYRLDISGNGYIDVLKYKAGKWIKLQDWAESAAIKTGAATNHLQVIAQGNQFTFKVNGQTAVTFTDDEFKQGSIGLTAGTLFDQAGVHIAFDNLTVSEVKP